jgi:predicted phage baseplate assembly protein
MPLFPPTVDTLRWDELVRQGRAQLPLVAPDWTDENTSDPGIAMLELLAWLIEAQSYRSGAVTDRDRRQLLALAGFNAAPPRAATCLLGFTTAAPGMVPAGLRLDALRDGELVPLTLRRDVNITGATVSAVATGSASAGSDGYRTGCTDLTRERAAGRLLHPFGLDPGVGDGFLIGLAAGAGLAAGILDLWTVAAAVTGEVAAARLAAEVPEPGPGHHSARTAWDFWDGTAWVELPDGDVSDESAALTRTGRVRLTLPAVPLAPLGDVDAVPIVQQSAAWLRCRISSGALDAAPVLAGIYVDAGEAVAAAPYPGDPANPVADACLLGVANGVPDEAFTLPQPWCDVPPSLWLVAPNDTVTPVTLVADVAHAGPGDQSAVLDPDGVTVRFGDGRHGRLPTPGATVLADGWWTSQTGLGELRPPITVRLTDDAHSRSFLGAAAATTTASVVAPLAAGAPAEDLTQLAARAQGTIWVHDRITAAARRAGAASLDEMPLAGIRRLDVPERAVTALDLERLALATPGVALWRVRVLPEVDPRLPGLLADGCITVVVVPTLPVARPAPSRALLRRVYAQLEGTRTLGTRLFVIGPDYIRVGVSARLALRPGAKGANVSAAAVEALRAFLHPVTGGASGQGWPFGRKVRRTEVLQLLDGLPGVDWAEELVLSHESAAGTCQECGDLALGVTQLVLPGDLRLSVVEGGRP